MSFFGGHKPKQQRLRPLVRLAGALVLAWLTGLPAYAQESDGDESIDVIDLDLEALAKLTITSVSRKAETLEVAAAAVYVITADDIRRSGARSLPELLRDVPGLSVARINSSSWAISARGFSSALADKLEILLDGRTLYTPLFSGVFWDQQGTVLEDIERIEVIRGPGGALWGANAVNGVINIITKEAARTPGAMLSATGGNEIPYAASLRHGLALGGGHLRGYVQGHKFDSTLRPRTFREGPDEWDQLRGGFRGDWGGWTFQGDLYDGTDGSPSGDIAVDGANLLARATTGEAGVRQEQYQLYYDRNARDVGDGFAERRETIDFGFLQNVLLGASHDLVWGAGYRRSADRIRNSETLIFNPDRRAVEVYNVYAQDDIQLTPDFTFTLGTKLEHNDFTGFEVQPTARFVWSRFDATTFWGAASRAVRTPNRLEHDARIVGGEASTDAADDFLGQLPVDPPAGRPRNVEECVAAGGDPILCELFFDRADSGDLLGNRDFESETVLAYELGLRHRLARRFSIDVALFFNDYQDLRGTEPDGANARVSNELEGRAYGGEFATLWEPLSSLRFRLGYSHLELDLRPKSGSADQSSASLEGNDPRHQVFLHADWRALDDLELQVRTRYVGTRPNQGVPSYGEMDLGLSWRVIPGVELALHGRNLLNAEHQEFGGAAAGLIERSAFLTLRLGR